MVVDLAAAPVARGSAREPASPLTFLSLRSRPLKCLFPVRSKSALVANALGALVGLAL
jgi:hypothetical protein